MVALDIQRWRRRVQVLLRGESPAPPPVAGGALRWIFPAISLSAPLVNEGAYLPSCVLLGAVLGVWNAHRSGAVWPVVIWGTVTGLLGAVLSFVEVQVVPDLRLLGLVTALVQALALLAIGGPATLSGWSARGMALVSLSGPLALALLSLRGAPAWGALAPALAVCLDLAALPLALMARRRAWP